MPTSACSSCSAGSSAARRTGEWEFKALWAHDQAEEAAATKQLVDYLDARRQRFPDMHVYHYNHTERSSLERLTSEHGVAELELERLIETGLFVDLFRSITASVQVGAETYGLKQIERLTGFERGHEIDRGAGAVVEYESWMADRDADHLTAIAAYNEDDVRATRAVRDWLVDQRPAAMPWRPAVLDTYEPRPGARRADRGAPRVRPRHRRAPDGRPARLLAAGEERGGGRRRCACRPRPTPTRWSRWVRSPG